MMKFIAFVFLISFWINNSFCQTRKLDSLNRLINAATSDTARINHTNDKIGLLQEVNLDSAIALGKINLTNAERINYAKGEADCRTMLASNYCFKGKYDSAKENLEQATKIYTTLNDSAGFLLLYSTYGILYGMQSNYDRSIMFFKRSAIFADKLHNIKRLNSAYQNIATSYQMQSNYSEALTYYQKALKSSEQLNDVKNLAYINLNLGLTYQAIGDTAKAIQALYKSINFAKKSQIKNVQLYAYSNLASVFDGLGQIQKAYDYAMIANKLGKETGDQGMEASSLSRAASQLAQMKKIPAAEKMARRAVLIADSSQQPLNIFQTNADLAYILKLQEKYAEAINHYEKALSAMKAADIYDNQSGRVYFNASECYEKTGAYKKALDTYKKYAEITDSVRSKQNIRKATELTMNYEFNKKQQALKANQEKRNEVFKTKQTALIIGLAVTLILAGYAFYSFKNKKRANTKLQYALNELKATQAQLIQSEKMASLGELTAGIAHEIQNPLNFVNNFSEVNNELIEEMNNETDVNEIKSIANNIKQNNEKISFHGKRADAIVKGMLQHSRKNTGEKEPTDINALADEYLRLSYHGLRAKDKSFNATMQTNFDESIGRINIVPQDIGRVLLNLFNNSFYAVNEKKKNAGETYQPTVSVETKKLNDGVQITVKDNGDGIPKEVVDKIFQPFFTTKPTGEGTGLGLSLSYDVITKVHKGTIKVESPPATNSNKETEGTQFIIQLPVS